MTLSPPIKTAHSVHNIWRFNHNASTTIFSISTHQFLKKAKAEPTFMTARDDVGMLAIVCTTINGESRFPLSISQAHITENNNNKSTTYPVLNLSSWLKGYVALSLLQPHPYIYIYIYIHCWTMTGNNSWKDGLYIATKAIEERNQYYKYSSFLQLFNYQSQIHLQVETSHSDNSSTQ